MPNEELIAKIKAEIERRRLHFNKEAEKYQALNNGYSQNCYGARDALRDLVPFLDSLESEKPSEGLEEEAVSYCFDNGLNLSPRVATDFARHFYELGSSEKPNNHLEHVPEIKETGTQGLEEAADEMVIRAFPEKKSYSTEFDRVIDYNAMDRKNYRDGIIAGAKWQKEQMMKEAVEGELEYNYDENGRAYYSIRPTWITGKIGDKVRVIIVKE